MRKRKNQILTIIKEDIENNLKSYVMIVVIFAVGIFLGVMLLNQTEEKSNIEKYMNTYIDETKMIQETSSLDKIDDSFKKIIVTQDLGKPWRNEKGYLIINILDFLLNPNSLDL